MDIRGTTMKRQSGFDVRKLAVTVAVSVSLAVIIACWMTGWISGRGMLQRRRAGMAAESAAPVSGAWDTAEASDYENPAPAAKEGHPAMAAPSGDEAGDIYREAPEQMVLVNRENPLNPAYDAMLRQICGGRLEASSRLYTDLQAMLTDAEAQGYRFWIASAYRSRKKQQELIDEEAAVLEAEGMGRDRALEEIYRETMPAGCSEHETGLALDILVSENAAMDRSQEEAEGNRWLRNNCQEYGFVLRYPEDKSAVTGVDYEPWHFRYVGKRAACFLQAHDLTLEEFYQLLE